MNDEMIAAYLAGECTQEESRQVVRWMNANAENLRQFRRYERLWQASRRDYDRYEPDLAKAWQRIRPVTERPAQPVFHRRLPRTAWFRGAAAILLVGVLLGGGLYFWGQPASTAPAWTVSTTAKGQKTSVRLADGTVVWLNSGSRLRYPQTFGQGQREVFLEGEAFFEVAKDPRKPFLIRSGETVTRVLGTSFDVRSYALEGTVEVVVVTGRVAFASRQQPAEPVVLRPGDKAVWRGQSRPISQSVNQDPNFLAWKTGRLSFRHTPLAQVLATLEHHYGVRLQVRNPALLNCRFTGTFKDARLEQVLDVFAYGSGIRYQGNRRGYVLTGNGCPKNP